jgi:hypothetical protein
MSGSVTTIPSGNAATSVEISVSGGGCPPQVTATCAGWSATSRIISGTVLCRET